VGKQKHQYIKRADRYAQVIVACMVLEYRGERPTVSKICRYLDVAISTHMRKIINELTQENQNPYLNKLNEVHWNGLPKNCYLVNHDALRDNCPDWYREKMAIIGFQLPLSLKYESA
jgi:hypothetical protein